MGDEEMALMPGVQYGLSSQEDSNQNKYVIFTKLTDSSFRAIQEYVKNQHKLSDKLSIQFLGNEGKFIIPNTDGSAVFNFSLSTNQDMEGPQGGFECVQQVESKNLERLGAIPYRMRVQANDEVYETTKHRMAVAEENIKNKCTRVIKPNGPDIGRKVKVKGTGRIIPPPSSYARVQRESPISVPISSNSQSRTSTMKPATSTNNNSHSMTARGPDKKLPDLMRRPIKERLIHVLALRPYKKPELYDRINKEGLRERERPVMTTILRQVAYIRDNTYHLQRHIWNDVQEDWPFYTEQEKAILKRRKPQNLTPPGSSDGSGQSPNSIHAGSPPAITAPPPNLTKRPGYHQGSDGLPTKKQRISHYKKSEPISFVPASTNTSNSAYNVTGSNGGNHTSSNNSNVSVGGNCTVDRSSIDRTADRVIDRTADRAVDRTADRTADRAVDRTADRVIDRTADRAVDRTADRTVDRVIDRPADRTADRTIDRTANRTADRAVDRTVDRTTDRTVDRTTDRSIDRTTDRTVDRTTDRSIDRTTDRSVDRTADRTADRTINSGSGNGNSSATSSVANVWDPRQTHRERSRDFRAERTAKDSDVLRGTAGNVAPSFRSSCLSSPNDRSSHHESGSKRDGGATVAISGENASGPSDMNADKRDRSDRSRDVREDREHRNRDSFASNATTHQASVSAANNADPMILPNLEEFETNSNECRDYLINFTTISNMEQKKHYKDEFYAEYGEYCTLHSEVAAIAMRFKQLYDECQKQLQLGNEVEQEAAKDRILQEYYKFKQNKVLLNKRYRFDYLHAKLYHIKLLIETFEKEELAINVNQNIAMNNSSTNTRDVDNWHY